MDELKINIQGREIKLRAAKLSEYELLRNLERQIVIWERQYDKSLKEGDIYYHEIQYFLNNPDLSLICVAEYNSVLIGCGIGSIKKNQQFFKNGNYGHIGMMAVDENFRGLGIGKLIIEELKKWFRKQQIKEIKLQVYNDNAIAINAYKACGFTPQFIEMRADLY